MAQTDLLAFGEGNAKLKGQKTPIFHFSIPAGHSCPGALECWAKATMAEGLIQDHPAQKYRCFSVSMEALYEPVRRQRWHNFTLLKLAATKTAMAELIIKSLPAKARLVRIHIGGDFFNQAYFDAWMDVAFQRPNVRFYAYTKSLHYWAERILVMPSNLILTASRGGRHDHLIERHQMKSVAVVFHPDEAAALNLEIDHDDSHAHSGRDDFALLIHGGQPAGSEASSALSRLKKENVKFAYSEA